MLIPIKLKFILVFNATNITVILTMLLPKDKRTVGENNNPEKNVPNIVLVTVINKASLTPIRTSVSIIKIFAKPILKKGSGFGIRFSIKNSKEAIAVKVANNTILR